MKDKKNDAQESDLPMSTTLLLGDTAAERRSPWGWNAALSSLTHAEKPSLSEAGPFLQSTWRQV